MTLPAFSRNAQQYFAHTYESPIEERLAWNLSKRLAPGVTLQPQMNFTTPLGRFRADLLLASPAGQTILECDGKDFHKDEHRDHVRDIALLYASKVQQVLRFSGEDLYGSLPDVLKVIQLLHPDAFDLRGLTLVTRHASPETSALSACHFASRIETTFGGVIPGRQHRLATVRRFALGGGHDRLAQFLVESFSVGTFRDLAEAVMATRHVDWR